MQRKRLFIVGAGGFGREVAGYASEVPRSARDWDIAGFLDDNPRALAGFQCPYHVLGSPMGFPLNDSDVLVCAIGDPVIKLRLARALKVRGAQFITLIHPTVFQGPGSVIGEGSIFAPYSGMTVNVQVGKFVTVNCHSGFGHDAVIGDGCTLSGHCDVTGGAVLGEGVFLGSHACVMPGVRVGDYAVVGAGSVVLRGVKPHTSVMGVPARIISVQQHH